MQGLTLHALSTSFSIFFKLRYRYFLLFQISLLSIPIVNLNQIQWNPTSFRSSLIARISLFDRSKFTQTTVKETLVKKLIKNEIVTFELLYRFQPNAISTKLKRNYTCENFSLIARNLNIFCSIFKEKN